MEWVLITIVALVAAFGVAFYIGRELRARGVWRARTAACDSCHRRAPVVHAHYYQNTGMLVMRRWSQVEGQLCRDCSYRFGARMTGHNLVLGWWGTISMIVTPLFILNNAAYLFATLTLPTVSSMVSDALVAQREYALNLLATKDVATVVEVLTQLTGAPSDQVRDFVQGLRRSA
jgi:hypothetical protein